MKYKKTITLLVIIIILLSAIAASIGIFSEGGKGVYQYQSINGEIVDIHGKGLYKNDSVSAASQAIAQDYITLFLGIPLLVVSLFLGIKKSIKGRLLLTGTLGYFLYTYTSYSFLAMYNSFFLIYVILMSISFFGFILSIMSVNIKELHNCFNAKFPVRFVGGFLIFMSFIIGMLWLGRIIPSLLKGKPPFGLEHYSTLIIQALDLGFVVPVGILSGILLIKRKSFGYLLASIITIKGITMLSAISAMVISQIYAGVEIATFEIIVFPIFNLAIIYCLILIMKSINEPYKSKEMI